MSVSILGLIQNCQGIFTDSNVSHIKYKQDFRVQR